MGSLPPALPWREPLWEDSQTHAHALEENQSRRIREARGVLRQAQGVCLVTPEMLCDAENNGSVAEYSRPIYYSSVICPRIAISHPTVPSRPCTPIHASTSQLLQSFIQPLIRFLPILSSTHLSLSTLYLILCSVCTDK